MDLHRTGKRPDWFKRSKRDYSLFQQIAQRTGGIVTPGNVITLVGLLVTLYGLWLLLERRFGAALLAIVLGRLCDIADGWVAHRTGTKGPVGELLDAGCDKLVTALGLLAFGITGLAPWWVLAAVAIPQVAIALVGGAALYTKQRLHPSKLGKFSMVFAWFGFGGILFAAWASSGTWHSVALGVGYLSIGGLVILSSVALIQYLQQYRGALKP